MAGVPVAADRMHAVRAGVGPRIGNGSAVADVAFHEHADVALVIAAGDVVVGKCAGEFGMRRAVAAGTFHAAVAGREPVQRIRAAGTSGVVANWLVAGHAQAGRARSNTDVYRIWPLLLTALPEWQA